MEITEKEASIFLRIHKVEQISEEIVVIDIEALVVADNKLVPHSEILFKLGLSEQKAITDSNGIIRNEFVFKQKNEMWLSAIPLNPKGKQSDYAIPIERSINIPSGEIKYIQLEEKLKNKKVESIVDIIWHVTEQSHFQKGEILVSLDLGLQGESFYAREKIQIKAKESGFLTKVVYRGGTVPVNIVLGEYIPQ